MEDIVESLKKKYSVHPLIFHRSLERSKSHSDLFDILDTLPKEYPIVWDELLRRWVHTKDMYQSENFTKNRG